jgi:GNAT superfamily N-acetyltransferase
MARQSHAIERLTPPVSDADLRGLARLLVDAVDSGAAVSFLPPVTVEQAEAWWSEDHHDGRRKGCLPVARDSEGIVGTVQPILRGFQTSPHRADIAKLVVHRRSRRTDWPQLMQAIEQAARQAGFTLLTLDTRQGDAAEELYRRGGWIEVGAIPGYGLDPRGHRMRLSFSQELR